MLKQISIKNKQYKFRIRINLDLKSSYINLKFTININCNNKNFRLEEFRSIRNNNNFGKVLIQECAKNLRFSIPFE